MAISQRVEDWQNARRAQRYPTKFDGVLRADRRSMPVDVADLSRVGGSVRGTGLPARGSEAVLTAYGLEVVATVVWRTEAACGLNFHRPIDPLEIVRHNMATPGGRPGQATRPRFTIDLQ